MYKKHRIIKEEREQLHGSTFQSLSPSFSALLHLDLDIYKLPKRICVAWVQTHKTPRNPQ